MVLRDGPIIRAKFPRPGTPWGDQKRDEFIAALLAICNPAVRLWLPKGTETTTSTDRSRNAATFTYDATVAARYAAQGSGLSVTFDGTDDEADMPDADALSFGDSAVDQPFSIVVWVNQTATATTKTILSKYDLTTGVTKREWQIEFDTAEKLQCLLSDESAGAHIGRSYNTALATGSVINVGATYDGSSAVTGIRLYSAGARVDDTNQSSGTYVAMENTASLVRLGFIQGAAAGTSFFNGSMQCVILTAKALSRDEMWELKTLGNAYFQLSL